MTKDGLTAKEAALVAAARREAGAQAAARAAAAPAAGASSAITPASGPAAAAAGIDVYERIARLIEVERRENERRRARMRRYGTALALLFILPFLTWSMLVLLPHMMR